MTVLAEAWWGVVWVRGKFNESVSFSEAEAVVALLLKKLGMEFPEVDAEAGLEEVRPWELNNASEGAQSR